jgi:serine/threonine protein kinase
MNLPYVDGKYALLRKIASGGMAEVFLAKHVGMDGFEKLVVLKRILPHLAGQYEYLRMFLDEAKTAADLRHSNVVSTFEIGEENGVYFMVMEFLHGQDVRSIFRKAISSQVAVPIQHSVGIIIDVCCGLHYAHTKKNLEGKSLGIVHRDISPQNIIVTYEGETKIVDFGIAKASHQLVETSSGVLKGKYSYMSPEQALGQTADHRTDIFALGIVLYEMTTLRRLFKKENEIKTLKAVISCEIPLPSAVISNYPKGLESIVLKALAKKRNERFSNCDEFRTALEEFLTEQSLAHSSSRLRFFMNELFEDTIEKEKAIGAPDLVDVSNNLFWTGSYGSFRKSASNGMPAALEGRKSKNRPMNEEEGKTVSTRIEVPRSQSRLLLVLSIGLGVSLAVTIILLWAKDFQHPAPLKMIAEKTQSKNIASEEKTALEGKSFLYEKPRALVKEIVKPISKKKQGRLKIVVEPWAEIYLDGVKIGETPLAARKLPEGKYQILLKNPQTGKKFKKSIMIVAGKDTLVRHTW